ncbi:poly-beta-1,6-N-acetyl-D-glucosamine N-deacetylase PgaB [Klebsiella pneumoniae]|uniref:poly-beta-1,6-N-acetyl-D-glucosamine N-deacetylase PgaB n=1 Tax=Klebsiella pneumoniae TaxID=573 RepID=UPI003D33D078
MLYEDLAGHAAFDGILFHDDALLQIMKMPVHRLSRLISKQVRSGSLSEIRKPGAI